MPEWLTFALKFVTSDMPKFLRKNLSRTILMTFVFTVLIQWIAIGPYGSEFVRKIYLSSVLTTPEIRKSYGVFDKNDTAIVDEWARVSQEPSFTDDSKEVPRTALQLARFQAQRAQPPFQPLGADVTVSSPDCKIDRPQFGQVFINMKSDFLRESGWKLGERVRIISQDGRGDPIIATLVAPRRDLPPNVHFQLNKIQFQMLHQLDDLAIVKIRPSEDQISQAGDDSIRERYPSKCPKVDY